MLIVHYKKLCTLYKNMYGMLLNKQVMSSSETISPTYTISRMHAHKYVNSPPPLQLDAQELSPPVLSASSPWPSTCRPGTSLPWLGQSSVPLFAPLSSSSIFAHLVWCWPTQWIAQSHWGECTTRSLQREGVLSIHILLWCGWYTISDYVLECGKQFNV